VETLSAPALLTRNSLFKGVFRRLDHPLCVGSLVTSHSSASAEQPPAARGEVSRPAFLSCGQPRRPARLHGQGQGNSLSDSRSSTCNHRTFPARRVTFSLPLRLIGCTMPQATWYASLADDSVHTSPMRIGITGYPTYGVRSCSDGTWPGAGGQGPRGAFHYLCAPIRMKRQRPTDSFPPGEVVSYPLFDHSPYTLSLAVKMLEVFEKEGWTFCMSTMRYHIR